MERLQTSYWLTRQRFEELVEEALDLIPDELWSAINNVAVTVEDWPSHRRLDDAGVPPGELLLGLYDDEGELNHVGFTSTISNEERPALTRKLERLRESPGFTGAAPGGPSRWSTERSADWQPLRPELVAEVRFDHVTAGRFRHGTKFMRWRPDKPPAQCTCDQLAPPAAGIR